MRTTGDNRTPPTSTLLVTALLAAPLLAAPLLATAEAARRVVRVAGPSVTVADLIGDKRAAALGATDVAIGHAPLPGQRLRIERFAVRRALDPSKRRARLPRYWLVVTEGQTLSCTRLAAEVSKALASQLDAGIEVKRVDCRRPLRLPRGEVRFSGQLAPSSARAGRRLAKLKIAVGRWPVRHLVLGVEIDGEVSVLVAAADLPRGAPLGRTNLRVERRQASRVIADALTPGDARASLRLRRNVRVGAVLRRGDAEAIPLVRRGGAVSMTVVLAGLRVTNRGIARADAALGELVAVFCPSSRRMVRARVVGPQRVVVDL